MSRHGYGSDFGDGAAAGLVGLAIILAVIAAYLLFRAVCFVIKTGVKYPVKGFKLSLAVFALLCILSGLLAYAAYAGVFGAAQVQNAGSFGILGYIGAFQLLITCAVIQRKYSGTFMKEDIDIREEILHRKWWSDDDTPIAA